MIKTILIFLLLFQSCSSTKVASYYQVQKSIEEGKFQFIDDLRVDEYLNAFDQPNLKSPNSSDVHLDVQYFYDRQPYGKMTALAQVAVRTRHLTKEEKEKKTALSIVLDISGSMSGSMIDDAKKSLIECVKELKDGSLLSITTFNDKAEVLQAPIAVTNLNRDKVVEKVQMIRAGGGTDIQEGLIRGYQQMTKFEKGVVSRLIVITDGHSNVGVTSPELIAKEAKVAYIEGARISTVGLGNNVDERVLRRIAAEGRGHYYFSNKASTLLKFLRENLNSTLIPVIKKSNLQIEANDGFKIKSIYGYKSHNRLSNIDFSELNVDDWRVLIIEIEGTTLESSNVKPINVSYHYTNIKDEENVLISSPSISWGDTQEPKINPIVARNSIIFTNALALKKIAKLRRKGLNQEAINLAELQLNNIKFAKKWDNSTMYLNEEKTLMKVLAGLRGKGNKEKINNKIGKQNEDFRRKLIQDGLDLAKQVVPGPWVLIISLFEAMI